MTAPSGEGAAPGTREPAVDIATTIYVRPDGPYIFTGRFSLEARAAPRDDASVVLCRCGRSANKPYCDGMHTRFGFVDAGNLAAGSAATDSKMTGHLTIVPLPNGPLRCTGPATVRGANGTRRSSEMRLCRCGGSATKPFCDGTHRKIGFIG